MDIYLNNVCIKLVSVDKLLPELQYDAIIEPDEIDLSLVKGTVLINGEEEFQLAFLDKLTDRFTTGFATVYVPLDDEEVFFIKFKKLFKNIAAGGGFVKNHFNELLLIFRNNLWDLPKGKLDEGEVIHECAVREVEEETKVKAEIESFFKNSYHVYFTSDSKVLKTTTWYKMKTIEARPEIKPQEEEGITQVSWVKNEEMGDKIAKTYRSIGELLLSYYKV